MTHKSGELTAKTRLVSLYAAVAAVVTLVLAGMLSPLAAYAATPTVKVGDITQNKSGDGKEVVLFNGTKYLVDNNGTLEWKADTDADFDMAKATFTLRYDTTSSGMDYKNQPVLGHADPKATIDHYNIIGVSGKHLTMGNESGRGNNVTLSLRDEEFLNPTPGTVEYWVNAGGRNSALPIGWNGYKVYSDRFSATDDLAWFALNADDYTQSTIVTKPIGDGSVGGENGIGVYEKPDPDPTATTTSAPPTSTPTSPSPSPSASSATPTSTPTSASPSPSASSATPTAKPTSTSTSPAPSPSATTPSQKPTQEPSTATITVTDDNGDPIKDATVTVVCDGKEVATYKTTGVDKVVKLSGKQCTIHVDVPEGYEPVDDVTITPKPGDQGVDIVATKLQEVTVTIVDSKTGEKLGGKVDVYDSTGNKVATGVKSGDTVKLPKGEYTAKQSDDISGYDKAGDEKFTVTTKAEDVTLTAEKKSTATITVTDDNGDPIEGATVTVICDGKEVASYETTGVDEVVKLSGEQCTIHVDVPEGYESVDDTTITPKPGDQDVDIVATKLQDVTVEIVDSKTGEVIDGLVDIYDSEGNKVAEDVKSGDTVKLPKGDYTAQQSGDITGYNPAGGKDFSVTDKAETVTLTATAKPSQVVITVTDKDNHLPIDATATIVCGSVKQTVVARNGKLVFNADTGTCTVTLSADGYESDTLTLSIPGKGQSVARDAQLTRESITRGGLRGDETKGKGLGNGSPNNANVTNPLVKAVPGPYGNGSGSMLARTGGAVGMGLTVSAMLLLAGVFLVAKRRSER